MFDLKLFLIVKMYIFLLDGELGFVCDCRPGYAGLNCESAIDECATNLCDPTGTSKCLDLDNKFECECREGFVGRFCETNVNDCASSPCLNGGVCKDEVRNFGHPIY
jgi:hypothetical protein